MSKGKDISTMFTKEENKKNGRLGYGLATREKKDVISPAQYGAFLQNWEMYFSNEPVALDNIHNSKTAKIVTSDATICIQPDKIALIELKEINGVPSLVIPVNGELKINGIEVELK